MSIAELEAKVAYLLDREEIRDVICNYSRGVDRFDRELLMSVFHPHAQDDHGLFVGDREGFWEWVRDMHGTHHHMTQHYIANQLVEIDGDVAHAESYMLYVALNKKGAPFSFMGGRYIDKLEKLDGRWAIAERLTLGQWAAPSINTEEGATTPEGKPNRLNVDPNRYEVLASQPKPSRDRNDPVYQRPLNVSPERRAMHDAVMAADRNGPDSKNDAG